MKRQLIVVITICARAAALAPQRARIRTRSVARSTAYLETLAAPVVDDSSTAATDVTAAYLNSLAAAPASLNSARPAINEVLKARVDPVADAKQRLLAACDAFEASQRAAAAAAEAAAAAAPPPKKRGLFRRGDKNALKAESYASVETTVDDASAAQRDAVVAALEELARLSPPTKALDGWRGRGGVAPSACPLDGRWKLRFTNAADARFRSDAETSQHIDAEGALRQRRGLYGVRQAQRLPCGSRRRSLERHGGAARVSESAPPAAVAVPEALRDDHDPAAEPGAAPQADEVARARLRQPVLPRRRLRDRLHRREHARAPDLRRAVFRPDARCVMFVTRRRPISVISVRVVTIDALRRTRAHC